MPSLNSDVSLAYRCVHTLANCFFSTFYDYTESGSCHIPHHESVILASNHVSFFDPPAIGAQIQRQLSFFARDTLFKGLLGRIISSIGTIPVTRDSADIKSLKAIFRVLKESGAIVIFPEGTRSSDGRIARPKPGTGMIACKAQATVIPTRVFGTFEAWGRQKKLPSLGGSIHIQFGQPLPISDVDPGADHPNRYEEASKRIMNAIAKLEAPDPVVV